MLMAARLMLPVDRLIRKNTGTPMAAAAPKQSSCLFVRLKKIFDLTRERSRGTGIYAAKLLTSFLSVPTAHSVQDCLS